MPLSLSQILNRRVHITKPQFHAWLGLVAKDELRALRRACEIGRARLEAQGLRRPRPPSSSSPHQVADAAAGLLTAAEQTAELETVALSAELETVVQTAKLEAELQRAVTVVRNAKVA